MNDYEIRDNISKNLKKYMEEKDINNKELANILNVSESTVGKWLLKKSVPRMGIIEQISNYFNIEKSDLLENKRKQQIAENIEFLEDYGVKVSTDNVEAYDEYILEPPNGKTIYLNSNKMSSKNLLEDLDLNLTNDLSNIPGIKIIKKFVTVPVLGEIACGEPIFCNQNYDNLLQIDADLGRPDFSLTAKGDSMVDAGIDDGDIVFFKNTSIVENGKIAAVIIDNTTTLKRFFKNDHEIILQPENKTYSPIIIREDDGQEVRVLGEMVGMYHTGSK